MAKDGSGGAKSTEGTKPLSKNQLNPRVKKKEQAKQSPHGGVCSMCGQESSSAKPNTLHAGCKGVNPLINGMFDYSTLTQKSVGFWITKEDLSNRRDANANGRAKKLASERHCIIKTGEDTSNPGGDVIWAEFQNGLGESITWEQPPNGEGRWVLTSEFFTDVPLGESGEQAAVAVAEELGEIV